ncbi:cupin domain-containing protein, partial [bacterium]|nr:cupin domain-containing protein [bacterium]
MSSTIPKRLEFPPGLTASDFLREFWQRRPLLMRDALPGLRSPLRGADLAGLAGA